MYVAVKFSAKELYQGRCIVACGGDADDLGALMDRGWRQLRCGGGAGVASMVWMGGGGGRRRCGGQHGGTQIRQR